MKVDLLYFGMLKERFGNERETLNLGPGASLSDVVRVLRERSSNQDAGFWASLAVAVNREYADWSTMLKDGDEVALLPPVSGGSGCGLKSLIGSCRAKK